jgi:hypothetical protein
MEEFNGKSYSSLNFKIPLITMKYCKKYSGRNKKAEGILSR